MEGMVNLASVDVKTLIQSFHPWTNLLIII